MWERRKVARLELRDFGGKRVQHVTGWVGTRHCGCGYEQGIRLDDHELTFGAAPCGIHGAAVARSMETVKLMPPSEEQMHVLWERLLDAEIEPHHVAE